MSNLSNLLNATPGEHKYITFKVGGYLFALPSQSVLKIMMTPSPEQGGLIDMGLVQLSQYSIQLLELPALLKLEQKDVEQKPNKKQTEEKTSVQTSILTNDATFLIILQAEQELWGIVVERSPDLRTISDSELKSVSTSQKLSGALKGVSHVVIYEPVTDERSPKENPHNSTSHQEHRQILLVLDLRKLLALSKAQTSTARDRPFKSKKANLKLAVSH